MSRGALFIVYGTKADRVLERARASVAKHHPELPAEVVRLDAEHPQGLLRKPEMCELSPFDETLFLDCDAMLLGRVDNVFEQAERYGLAATICECPWARRYQGSGLPLESTEWNTGVIGFSKNHRTTQLRYIDPDETAEHFFETWKRCAATVDSSIVWAQDQGAGTLARMECNDQASFTAALEECNLNPAALPLNYNFRPDWHRTWFGPLKVWHSYRDPPPLVLQWAAYYEQPNAVVQFHDLDRLAPPKMDLLYAPEKFR